MTDRMIDSFPLRLVEQPPSFAILIATTLIDSEREAPAPIGNENANSHAKTFRTAILHALLLICRACHTPSCKRANYMYMQCTCKLQCTVNEQQTLCMQCEMLQLQLHAACN